MPTDMGIREGTFTVRFGDVEVDAGAVVPDVGRVGADGARAGGVTVVGGSDDGPVAAGGPDVARWGWAAESSRR
jgi:hypothetical protein